MINQKVKISSFSIFFSMFFLIFFSCDEQIGSSIPYVQVNVSIDIQDPRYNELFLVSGRAYIENEGYHRNGIVVYQWSIDEFKAFDRTCTYKIEDNCAVTFDERNVTRVNCPCCKSVFDLIYGTATSGLATENLKEYRTSFNGTTLRIYN